jgi:hypothetical protein
VSKSRLDWAGPWRTTRYSRRQKQGSGRGDVCMAVASGLVSCFEPLNKSLLEECKL